MNIVYSNQPLPDDFKKTIFLAGPTSRENGITKWRKDSIEVFKKLKYEGVVFIPEIRNGIFNNKYEEQIKWETEMLKQSDCILFWIDRKYSDGFTTNVEWGMYCKSGKAVIGFPKDSEKNRYIEMQCKNYLNLEVKYDLKNLIEDAIKMAKK